MAVAVTRFALEGTLLGILSPLLLLESFAAFFALNTAGIMLTRACEKTRIVNSAAARIQCAGAGMSVAHAAASDRDVLYRVEITTRYRRILTSDRHEMTKQIFSSQQPDSDVRSACPFLKRGRVEITVCRWSRVEQTNNNFSRLERHNFTEFSGANDVIVLPDGL